MNPGSQPSAGGGVCGICVSLRPHRDGEQRQLTAPEEVRGAPLLEWARDIAEDMGPPPPIGKTPLSRPKSKKSRTSAHGRGR